MMRLEGQQFGKYLIMRLLKRGGMGEVYLAQDTKINRRVAIKVIRTDTVGYTDDEEAREASRLFLREAQVVASLRHEHILPLYDAGEEYVTGMTLMYMVMPLCEEGSLADWLHKHNRGYTLSPMFVRHILKQATSALQHAHERDIVHQDVKPSNFLVRDSAQHPSQLYLQLADFGVAKLMTTTSHSQVIRGTPTHMAPEQWEGRAVPASDQYALAIMAYELLTGQPPFEASNNQQMWYKHSNAIPTPPSELNPTLPLELDDVLGRALAKTPQARYKSVSAFALAFRQALHDAGNIKQQIVINEAEARVGTRRIINIDGRRQLAVNVPPGIQDGQKLYFDRLGNVSAYGGPPGALILTIIIDHPQTVVSLADTAYLPQTAIPSEFNENEEEPPPPGQRHGTSIPKVSLLLSLALMLIIGSVIAATLTLRHLSPGSGPNGITPVVQNTHVVTNTIGTPTPTLTPSPQVNITATAQASATSQATNATATAIAQRNATATAVANAQATAQATATVGAYISLERSGTQSFTNQPQDNSVGLNWDTTYLDGSGCQFTGGVYLSSAPVAGHKTSCYAHASNYSNFFYEVQLRIMQGDQGGMLFRGDEVNGNFYYYHVDIDGKYALDVYINDTFDHTVISGSNPDIDKTPGHTNLLAVQADGSILTLFVNDAYVNSVNDTTFSQGEIGLMASSVTSPTIVTFSNAELHTH